MVWLNLRQIRLLEFDFRKKVKVQLYRSNIVKNVETMFWIRARFLISFVNCVIIRNEDDNNDDEKDWMELLDSLKYKFEYPPCKSCHKFHLHWETQILEQIQICIFSIYRRRCKSKKPKNKIQSLEFWTLQFSGSHVVLNFTHFLCNLLPHYTRQQTPPHTHLRHS